MDSLKEQINIKKIEIDQFFRKIEENKDEISVLEDKLYDVCKHEWKYDINACFDDISKYYCIYCGLYKRYNYMIKKN